MPSLVGVWKLVETRAFDDVGQEVPSPLGPHPMGVGIIDAERIMVVGGDGRTALPPRLRPSARSWPTAAGIPLTGRSLSPASMEHLAQK
jgi:hypothetical protein